MWSLVSIKMDKEEEKGEDEDLDHLQENMDNSTLNKRPAKKYFEHSCEGCGCAEDWRCGY